jgi:predicted transcriptional regulator
LEDIKNLTARDVMGEAPPIIDKNAKIELVKQILRFYPLILVKEEEKLAGLVTKTDLINSLVS